MIAAGEHIQARYERKFVFDHFTPHRVQQLVKTHPANFHEIFHQRDINNIYFDKPGLDHYFDNYDGNSSRQKVRIRWYGNRLGKATNPILEFKFKQGELGTKRSFLLPDFEIDEQLNADLLSALIQNSNLPEVVKQEMMHLQPRLLNTYTRTYYRSFDHRFRFTIDSELTFFAFQQRFNRFSHCVCEPKKIVLELKYAEPYAESATSITNALPARMSKFSKYQAGMEKLYPVLA